MINKNVSIVIQDTISIKIVCALTAQLTVLVVRVRLLANHVKMDLLYLMMQPKVSV